MAAKEFDLLCIGNALVDVFTRVDGQTALRFGITRSVQHIKIEKLKELLNECNTAPPKQAFHSVTISSGGGAKKPHARRRACSSDKCSTAPPRETFHSTVFSSGGGAANVAKIAGLLGANVCFTGSVCSHDKFAQFFEDDLLSAE